MLMRLTRIPAGLSAIYALFFLAELGQSVLVPLVPMFGREFAMSTPQTGVLLSAATFATVVAAVPAGLLAERIGPLRVSIGAAALLGASAVMQALAADFETMLMGRLVFGVAFATIWTAGITLLSSGGPAAMAGAVTVGGLSHLVAPRCRAT
jgi:predicted MFS family arabinose efflux permease